MPIVTRTGILPANFAITIEREISPVEHRLAIAAFSAAQLANVQLNNVAAIGYAPKYQTTVDGRQGASPLAVRVDGGRIVFDFELFSESIKEVVAEAFKALRDASPVISGTYRDGHGLYVNGERVEEVPPASIKPTDRIMISNPVPYARRIEVGMTKSGRAFVMQVPNHIYERVAKVILTPRFGNQLKIRFDYVDLSAAEGNALSVPARRIRGGERGDRSAKVDIRKAPAIFIEAIAA
jgi:hypothetical protein